MTDEKTLSEDKIREEFEKRINQSGHSLEDKVERILLKIAWSYRRGAHYMDLDNKSDRQIDFLVSIPNMVQLNEKKNPAFRLFNLIIECKNLPDHAWIFSGSEHFSLTPDYLFTGISEKNEKIITKTSYLYTKNFTANGYSELFLNNGKLSNKEVKSNKKIDNLYEAIVQVTKASKYRQIRCMDDFQKKQSMHKNMPDELHIFQPLIIFHGRMYKTDMVNDNIRLEPIKFVCIEKEFVSENYHETNGEIHIVSFDWLIEYFDLLTSSYGFSPPNNVLREIFDTRSGRDFL